MADTANPYLAKATEKMLEFAQQASDFSSEQIPLLVQECLRYWAGLHIVWMVIGVATILGALYGLRQVRKYHTQLDRESLVGAVRAAAFIGGGIGSILLAYHTTMLIKVLLAPRLYLLSELASMLK